MPGAEGWQLSNPPILSLATLRASMDIFHEVGMERLRAKSVSLTGYLEFLLGQRKSAKFSLITPRESEQPGCSAFHTSLGKRAGAVRAAHRGRHHRRLA